MFIITQIVRENKFSVKIRVSRTVEDAGPYFILLGITDRRGRRSLQGEIKLPYEDRRGRRSLQFVNILIRTLLTVWRFSAFLLFTVLIFRFIAGFAFVLRRCKQR